MMHKINFRVNSLKSPTNGMKLKTIKQSNFFQLKRFSTTTITEENIVSEVAKRAKKRDSFVPTYKHVIETFLDSFGAGGLGAVWSVPTKEDEELRHWTDPAFTTSFVRNPRPIDKKQIIRVQIECENPEKDRFVEIHFNQRIILCHEHDLVAEKKPFLPYSSEMQRILIENGVEKLKKLMLTKPTIPGEEDFFHSFADANEKEHLYLGIDIPANWMTAFKTVKYLSENYVPSYLDDVNYFEFFRYTQLMDELRDRNTVGNNEDDIMHESYDRLGQFDLPLAGKSGVYNNTPTYNF